MITSHAKQGLPPANTPTSTPAASFGIHGAPIVAMKMARETLPKMMAPVHHLFQHSPPSPPPPLPSSTSPLTLKSTWNARNLTKSPPLEIANASSIANNSARSPQSYYKTHS
uniref:Uncharacterized protein n=1 Tax=Physcomitrium patens TaxID=3218 RepID=A0A2K1JC38_PHYPA|nr:hypothetical protein PHYPA_019367 [Physcomitrium patens]